jgi:hypothetical protein
VKGTKKNKIRAMMIYNRVPLLMDWVFGNEVL